LGKFSTLQASILVANSESVSGHEGANTTGWQVAEAKKTMAPAKPKSGTASGFASAEATVPVRQAAHDVGTALRNAFRATVEEDIPAEMLDLLRRLD
jgi:hypothetical protein